MQWRSWLKHERALLARLALMLALMLVVGVYFLERLDTGLEKQQRAHLQALAAYLAADSSEYLAADNRVSLGVIARQAADLDTVAAVAVRDTQGRTLARAGTRTSGSAPIQQPVTADTGSALGRVDLWPAAQNALRQRVETGFVLVVLLLLMLRVVAEVIRRHLRLANGFETAPESGEPEPQAALPRGRARLWIRPHDGRRLWNRRYAAAVVERALAEHGQLLERVAGYYGARVIGSLDATACLEFRAGQDAEAAFQALCAAELFLCSVRGREEAADGGPTPAFRLLVSTRGADEIAPVLEAGHAEDGLRIPADELDRLELADRVRLGGTVDEATTAGGEALELRWVTALAPRYERLIETQANKLRQAESG